MKPQYEQTNDIPMSFFYDVRDGLCEEDERIIHRNASTLMAVRHMGEGAATELLARIGMFLNSETKDLRKDLKPLVEDLPF